MTRQSVNPGDFFRIRRCDVLFVSNLFTGQTESLSGRRDLTLVVSNVDSCLALLSRGTLYQLTVSELTRHAEKLSK